MRTLNYAETLKEEQLKEEILPLLRREDEGLTEAEQLWLDICQYFLELKYEFYYPNSLYQTRDK